MLLERAATVRRPALGVLVAALGVLLGACNRGADGPSWEALADGPAAVIDGLQTLASPDGVRRTLEMRGGAPTLELELAREHWQSGADGLWRAQLGFQPSVHEGHELAAEGTSFALAPARARSRPETLAPGTFVLTRSQLVVRLAPNAEPPARARLACRLAEGAIDKSASAEPGRVRGRRYSGAGFAVWPGARVERSLELAPGRALRFATALDPLVTGASSALPPTVFRIELDGAVLFEHAEPNPSRASLAWHAVALPERTGATRLVFTCTGTPAYASFLDPRVGPREVGRLGARPWGAARPDVVVFLADTFRADSMKLYGGKLALTPNLDRFARESLAFARAWSVGTFTLSAHASMFSGLYPHQAGVLGETHAIPDELELLAERFAAAGYRTGAITDSGIVSQAFALDQGFALFDEKKRPLADTLAAARAFLAADDGRPVLLFVHTYRTHRPFVVSEETRREHGARLGITGTFRGLERELVALAEARGHVGVTRAQDFPKELLATPEAAAIVAKLRAHYLGGVIDLDRDFEAFHAELAARGSLAHGFLVFTSDHGESFGEHAQLYHKDDVYEEQTRVPLLLAGRGLTPRVVRHAASLLDLAPTLAALTGIAPDPEWLGTPLVALDRERALYAFECDTDPTRSTFAWLEADRKLIGLEDEAHLAAGDLLGAFDLERDPRELDDLAERERWPAETLTRVRPTVLELLQPRLALRAATLDAEKSNELDALGYGGGSDEDEAGR